MPPEKLLGFDPCGEVFSLNGEVFRGLYSGHGAKCKIVLEKILSSPEIRNKVVPTEIRQGSETADMGYDLVLKHRKIPFITYAHEWPSAMVKEAALLQIDLCLCALEQGMVLKDCGVTSNVLFDATTPIFVDLLSFILKEDLIAQEFLTPTQHPPSQTTWSTESRFFNEIFERMFLPYSLYPLYFMAQRKFAFARKRMLETFLNASSDIITKEEAFQGSPQELLDLHQRAKATREATLAKDNWRKFLTVLQQEVLQLNVSVQNSDYTNYYDLKNEYFDFQPTPSWKLKQRAVYDVLHQHRPQTVLDIGANTGWFSILAAKLGATVVSMDNDEASMNVLFQRAKAESLKILPLIMDITHPTPDISKLPELAQDPHVLQSRIPGDAPVVQSAHTRLKCDWVLALAIIHHLTLGRGLSLQEVVKNLSTFSKQGLILEYVDKNDPLIVNEPTFFPAYCKDTALFNWYTKDNWIRELSNYFGKVDFVPSDSGREMLICSERKAS
jgi:predicted RNA methylase